MTTLPPKLTDKVRVLGIDVEPSQHGAPVPFHLLVEDALEVVGADLLVKAVEVDVVVDEDAALAERLNVDAVEGVADKRVAIGLCQLQCKK
jgi:hypothetical protein